MKDRNIRLNELSEAGIVVILFLSYRGSVPCILTARMACCHKHDVLLGGSGRELARDPPIAHDKDAVAHPQDLGQLRGDHQNRNAFPGKGTDHVVNAGFCFHVDTTGGFVKNKDGGLRGKPFRKHHLLLVPPLRN